MNSLPITLENLLPDMLTIAWAEKSSILECNRRIREAVYAELSLRGTRWNLCANSLPAQEHGFGPKHEVIWQYGQSNQPLKLKLAPWDDPEMRKRAVMWKGLGIISQ